MCGGVLLDWCGLPGTRPSGEVRRVLVHHRIPFDGKGAAGVFEHAAKQKLQVYVYVTADHVMLTGALYTIMFPSSV